MSKKLILLIGAPGSGKTTDGKIVAQNHSEITSYSTGELIQKEIKSGSATGRIEASFVEHGDLVPTAMVVDAVLDAIKAAPTEIVLIDGFPRKPKQLNEFCDIVFNSKGALEVIAAIEVRVSEATAKERFLAAGHSEEVFEHEMRDYLASVADIEKHYGDMNILKVVDGEKDLDAVTAEIEAHLKSLI